MGSVILVDRQASGTGGELTECGVSRRLVSPRLVGRERELAALWEAVVSAPAVAVVEGEAGIGKSRLVAELVARLESVKADDSRTSPRQAFRVMVGRCHRVREPFPLGPVLEAVRSLGVELGCLGLSPLAGALRPLLPELAGQLPPALEPLGDAVAERHRVFRAVKEVLDAAGPAVLLVEDLHWADEQTIEFLGFLLDEQPERLAVVATFRGEEATDDLRASLARPPPSTATVRIELNPLDEAGTRTLVTTILDSDTVSDRFASYVFERAEGVPFAVEEVLSLLRERGSLVRHGDRWERRALAELGVPRALRESVRERVAWLSADARALIEAAAVLEVPSSDVVALEVSGLHGAAAVRAISDAVGAGLLQEHEGGIGFRHVLASQAVYEGLPAGHRRKLHSRAADALASCEPCPLGKFAHHLRAAERMGEWATTAEHAAAQAAALGHDAQAVRLLEDVLRYADLDTERRGRIAVTLGRAAIETLRPTRELIELLADVLEDDLPPKVRGELSLRVAVLLDAAGSSDAHRIRRLLRESVEDLDDRPDLKAWAMVVLAIPARVEVLRAEHKAWLDRIVEILPRVDDPTFEVFLLGKVSMVLIELGDPGWRPLTERILDLTGATPRHRHELSACYSVAVAACYAGHYQLADRFVTIALSGAAGGDNRQLELRLRSAGVLLDFCRGRWDGLDQTVKVLLDDLADCPPALVDVETADGCLALARGNLDEARRRLAAVTQQVEGMLGGSALLALAVSALARRGLVRSEFEDAVTTVDRFLDSAAPNGLWTSFVRALPTVAEVMVTAERVTEARDLADRWDWELANLDAPLAPAVLCHVRGFLAMAAQDWDAAAKYFLTAADNYETAECPYEAAQVREKAAVVLLQIGDTQAEETLRRALATYQRLGASWDLARCTHIGREHAISLPVPQRRGRKGYGDALSPREEEVARLAGLGYTNKEIAEQLFLSPATVSRHLGSAMRKSGVHSRRALQRVDLRALGQQSLADVN